MKLAEHIRPESILREGFYFLQDEKAKRQFKLNPFRLVSLWEMLEVEADLFVQIGQLLQTWIDMRPPNLSQDAGLSNDDLKLIKSLLTKMPMFCEILSLQVTIGLLKETLDKYKHIPPTWKEMETEIGVISTVIKLELESRLFLFLPSYRADYYSKQYILQEDVLNKCKLSEYDMEEACKCFALGRYTASIFHLMRIMENLVQIFGSKLGVQLVGEKNWQNILDEINKAIKTKPPKDQITIECASISSYLYNVKLAWRNPTMHPKQTYTEEEAERIINSVKAFIIELAKAL